MGNYNHLRAGNLQAENDKPNLVLMLWICYLFFFSHFNATAPSVKNKVSHNTNVQGHIWCCVWQLWLDWRKHNLSTLSFWSPCWPQSCKPPKLLSWQCEHRRSLVAAESARLAEWTVSNRLLSGVSNLQGAEAEQSEDIREKTRKTFLLKSVIVFLFNQW